MSNKTHLLSRRVAVISGLSVGASLLAACSSSSSKSASSSNSSAPDTSSLEKLPGKERLRQQTKYLEPSSYVKTYTIDSNGKGGAFRTFQACYDAVMLDKQKKLGVGGLPGAQSNPWDWRLIKVMPGTYKESAAGAPPHTALVGTGSKPSDVSVIVDSDDDAIATTGRSIYVRNMQFTQASKNPDAHPMRDEGQAGDVGLGPLQCRTIVFEDVIFTASAGAPWGKTAVDILSGPGTTIVFNRCTFDAPGQAQMVNLVTNAKAQRNVSQYFMLNCTVIGNQSKSTPGTANPSTAFPVGVPDFSEGRSDLFVWMDGHWQVGDAVPVGGLLAFPLTLDAGSAMKTTKAGTQYVVVTPGASGISKVIAADGVLPVQSQVPQGVKLPLHCLSRQEETFFGEPPKKNPVTINGQDETMTMQVTSGQTYWVAIDLQGKALATTTIQLQGAGSALANGLLTLDNAGKPQTDGNAVVAGKGNGQGSVELATRWYYPGQGPVWVGMTFSADVKVPAIKAAAGKAFTSTGPATSVPAATDLKDVAVGSLVPSPSLVTVAPVSGT